jgi:hypothetical protein
LSQEQVPSLHIQHLPNRLRFTLQQKIASAAHIITELVHIVKIYTISTNLTGVYKNFKYIKRGY